MKQLYQSKKDLQMYLKLTMITRAPTRGSHKLLQWTRLWLLHLTENELFDDFQCITHHWDCK
jgi:hypothetical protein